MTDKGSTDKFYRKREKAAALYSRVISDNADEQDFMLLTHWLEEDEAHAEIYADIVSAQTQFDDLSAEQTDEVLNAINALEESAQTSHAKQAKYNMGWIFDKISSWLTSEHSKFGRHAMLNKRWAAPAFTILIAIASIGLWQGLEPLQHTSSITAEYATQNMERRSLTLADGSEITLNANTQIETTYSDNTRFVKLFGGEAIFDVKKDPSRPFIVAMGKSEVRVLGTKFNILKDSGEIAVTVSEGTVEFSTVNHGTANSEKALSPQKYQLNKGYQVRQNEHSGTTIVGTVDPDYVLAWQNGQLVYDNANLSQIAADIHRYFGVEIIIDGNVKTQTFSGVLNTNSLDEVIRLLENSIEVTITKDEDRLVIRPG